MAYQALKKTKPLPKVDRLVNGRKRLLKIKQFTENSPLLSIRYQKAKEVLHIFGHSAFYEISGHCNMACKSCYFFDNTAFIEQTCSPIKDWEILFQKDRTRGITMGNFFGAEPSLEQEKLLIGSQYIPYGCLSTNGSIYIDRDVSMRIFISTWGTAKTERTLRGNSFFMKALENYSGDERAVACFTVNRKNIDDIKSIAHLCQEHGISLTFNMYSPTFGYNKKSAYPQNSFNKSEQEFKSLCFDRYTLDKTHDMVESVLEKYKKTVLYSSSYNRWITQDKPLYHIDKMTGVATDCGSRINKNYILYGTDSRPKLASKCIHPSVECSTCRVYGAAYASRLFPKEEDVESKEKFMAWLDLIELIEQLFIYKKNQ